MKEVTLVRHAKSSWADAGQPDHARPLNARGQRIAPQMASWIARHAAARGAIPERIHTSDAVRALETARSLTLAFSQFGQPVELVAHPELYLASETQLLHTIWSLPEKANHALFVGHNPGLHDLANQLDREQAVPRFPTCAACVLRFDAERWSEVQPRKGERIELWFPKELGLL